MCAYLQVEGTCELLKIGCEPSLLDEIEPFVGGPALRQQTSKTK